MGLTVPELKALELGLTVLEQERPPDDRPVIDSACQRLRKLVAHLPIEDDVHELRMAETVPSEGLPYWMRYGALSSIVARSGSLSKVGCYGGEESRHSPVWNGGRERNVVRSRLLRGFHDVPQGWMLIGRPAAPELLVVEAAGVDREFAMLNPSRH
jgi:hypothetical protein